MGLDAGADRVCGHGLYTQYFSEKVLATMYIPI